MTTSLKCRLAVVAIVLGGCTSQPPPTCSELVGLQMSPVRAGDESASPEYNVQILAAEQLAADDALPAHCKVTGVIGPEINFELLLPQDWNGKFLMGGGGGFVGSVQNQAQDGRGGGPTPLERGYATAGTDTGHQGSGIQAAWALHNEERELNFGHRAVHLTAEVVKGIVQTYYDDDITYSYFFGCSRGGGQGMMESQRYPSDFDGIISGAPAFNWTGIGAGMIRNQQEIYPDPNDLSAPIITEDNRVLLETALLDACDARDGMQDGVIDDPRRCDFDPASLPRCRANMIGAHCVTAAQLKAIETIYYGPSAAGRRLFPGFPFGGEHDGGGWDVWITGRENGFGPGVPSLHYAFGTEMYKYLIFDDPDWDYSTYDFSNFEQSTATAAAFLNATDTDLSPFRAAGGKLLMWHGWSDPALTALATTEYYDAVEAGDPNVRDYFRLFMMPGVLHCGDGPGPDKVDWITALEQWVEEGSAPDRLLATRFGEDQSIERTRPLCSYPQVAAYVGSGSADEAANFSCQNPMQ